MRKIFLLAAIVLSAEVTDAGEWPGFRGADTTSVSLRSQLPTAIVDQSIAWKTGLPGRGLSGPTIVGDKVYLSACSGDDQNRLHVLCFDKGTGKQLWERQSWATGRTMCHKSMSVAAPQIASDGRRVFALFSSNDLVCYDLAGNLQWFRGLTYDYPNASNSLGMASSPLVVGRTLIVQVESDSESFAVGLDVESGTNRWKIPRPQLSNWTSPTLYRGAGQELVLLQSAEDLAAVRAENGSEVWKFKGSCSTIPSTTVDGENIYVPCEGVTAIRPTAGKVATLWKSAKLGPATASPVVARNRIFTLNKSGVLTCGQSDLGSILWQTRLDGRFSSTPVFAGEHLYLFNENGMLFVVHPNDSKGEIVSRYDLKEPILATPAVADDSLYIRSDKHLWKFAVAR